MSKIELVSLSYLLFRRAEESFEILDRVQVFKFGLL